MLRDALARAKEARGLGGTWVVPSPMRSRR
jgi:hypothetical protein